MKRKALGRGLDALLPQMPANGGGGPSATLRKIAISSVRPNRLQPRKNFDPERLSELSQSIKEHGLAQPIVVSFDAVSNSYELIAGERRLQACKLAGLSQVDAVIRTPRSDKERLAVALVENIQRDNLNAIEAAVAYKRLMTEFGVTQINIATELGKSKAAISNTLRLLELPDDIQKAVQFERLSEGHGRALLMVHDAIARNKLFRLALEQQLSVRAVEKLAKQLEEGKNVFDPQSGRTKLKPIKSVDVRALEKRLEHSLGTKVDIRTKNDQKSGRIIIHFFSLNDFDKILKMLKN